MIKTKDFALSVKEVAEEGTFEGYVSVAGNVDSYGEKVMPGAFADSLARHKSEGTKPLLLWQHDPYAPIGIWEDMAEDGKGLWAKGRLLKGIQQAEEAHILMREGAIRGLSFGYREIKVVPNGAVRELVELDIIEASIVSFPANHRARVEMVKSEHVDALRAKLAAGELPSERELEKGMRDAFQMSNSEAERAVRLFFKRAQGDPEVTTAEPSATRLTALARAAAAGIHLRKFRK